MNTNYTQSEKKENTSPLSYDAVKEQLVKEASSLLDKDTIQRMLQSEKLKFDNAARIGISPSVFIGSNTLRYCKDTIRKQQPFSFVYFVLNFLTELSIGMVLCGLCMGIFHLIQNKEFLTPFPLQYFLLLVSCFVLFLAHKKRNASKMLSASLEKEDYECRKQYKKKIAKQNYLLFFFYLLLLLVGSFCLHLLTKKDFLQITPWQCLWCYVICMVLSGIHNTLYSSHFISFLSVGVYVFTRRSPPKIADFTTQYLDASYLQLLATHQKTRHDFETDATLRNKIKTEMRSRMITQRVYYALANFIFLLLDILCIWHPGNSFTFAFAIFLACSLIITFLFIIAFIAANHVLKTLKKGNI